MHNGKSIVLREFRKLGWRVVSTKRKRKLVRRGEFVYWNVEHNCWLWDSEIDFEQDPAIEHSIQMAEDAAGFFKP